MPASHCVRRTTAARMLLRFAGMGPVMVVQPQSIAANRNLFVEMRDGVGALPREQWDRLVTPGQGPLTYGYLSAWEQVALRGLHMRPLVVRDGERGDLVAAVPACFYDLDPACLTRSAPPVLIDLLRRLRERLLMVRVYELGGPSALAFPILHGSGVGAEEAARLLVPQAIAEAERGGAHVVLVQDFVAVEGPCRDVFAHHGFAPVAILPTVVLELGFRSFEAYLACMRAPYRRRARRVLHQSRGLQVERHDDFSALAPELARLARQVYDRAHEMRREVLTEGYFRAASAAPQLSLLGLRANDGSLLCFGILMDDGPCLHFLNCGFDAEDGRAAGAYFRLLYEIVRTGIDDGYSSVNFGVTTLAPKLDTGGVPVPLVAWMRYHRPLVQRLCAAAAQRLLRPAVPAPRHVFKESVARDRRARGGVTSVGCT